MNLRLRLTVWRLRRDRERREPPPTKEDRERLAADLEEAWKNLRHSRFLVAEYEQDVKKLARRCRKAGVSSLLLDRLHKDRFSEIVGFLAGVVCIVGLLLQNHYVTAGGFVVWLSSPDMRGKYLR